MASQRCKTAAVFIPFELNESLAAVTGHTCEGRGVTLHAPDMPFTHALYIKNLINQRLGDTIRKKADLYQLIARPAGNFGDQLSLLPGVFTTDPDITSIATGLEEKV